jgi:hypothetical protein
VVVPTLFSALFNHYSIMKKPNIATVEKPAPKNKIEQAVATELKPKKTDSAQMSSNKPKAEAPKPAIKAKDGKPAASVAVEAKLETERSTLKSAKKAQTETTKPAVKAKTEKPISIVFNEEKPKQPAAKKSTNKPKPATPKPVLEAKAEQPVVAIAEEAKPKKARAAQHSPKKARAAAPKTKTTASEIANPGQDNLPSGNIWPDWVEKLLKSFGIKIK